MTRCKRCGAIYSDGNWTCPERGYPGFQCGSGISGPSQGKASEETAFNETHKKRQSTFFTVPLPFAVVIVGVLLNPALPDVLMRLYLKVTADYVATQYQIVTAIGSLLRFISTAVIITVLDASMRSSRGKAALKFAAALLIMLTLFSMMANIQKFFELAGSWGLL